MTRDFRHPSFILDSSGLASTVLTWNLSYVIYRSEFLTYRISFIYIHMFTYITAADPIKATDSLSRKYHNTQIDRSFLRKEAFEARMLTRYVATDAGVEPLSNDIFFLIINPITLRDLIVAHNVDTWTIPRRIQCRRASRHCAVSWERSWELKVEAALEIKRDIEASHTLVTSTWGRRSSCFYEATFCRGK